MGAADIYMVDHHQYRLDFAQQHYHTHSINFDDGDPSQIIIDHTQGRGVDASIDAVGFEAKGSAVETVLTTLKLEPSSGEAIRHCIAATRRGGVVSIPGVYAGFIHAFLIGDAFEKGLTFRMGQTHVQKYLPELLEHIENGDLSPADIITHRMNLEDAATGYDIFNKKEQACRKVVLTP
jgi:threonine dehydrogenase-like Zn-dependent dehydrogenase